MKNYEVIDYKDLNDGKIKVRIQPKNTMCGLKWVFEIKNNNREKSLEIKKLIQEYVTNLYLEE